MTQRATLFRQLRRPSVDQSQVVVGSAWMLASTAAVSAGSFFFWLIAARLSTADVVGRSAGLFSAVFFLSYVTSLGLPVAVGRFGAGPSPVETARFRVAAVATVAATVVGSTVFVLIDPADLLDPVNDRGRLVAWFVVSTLSAGAALSVLVDVRLMGHRRWRDVFVRSAAIGIVRIPPLMWAVDDDSGFWVFVTAVGGYAVTALPYLPGLLRSPERHHLRFAAEREVVSYAGVNYLSQLAVQAPFFVTPLVVALTVSDDDNATFYLSWGIMSVVYLGIHLLGRTLLVEGSRDHAHVGRQARSTLALGLAVAVPALVLSVPLSPVAERIYGTEHDDMSTMLPLLMAGTVPWVITRTSLAVARARAHARETLSVAAWSALTVVAGVAIGGITGDSVAASLGWLVGSMLALLVSVPTLRRQLKDPDGP